MIHSHFHPLHLPFSFLSIFYFSSIFVLVPFLLVGTTTISYLCSSPEKVEEDTKASIFISNSLRC
ncbi:hypothetical protein AAZX31_18G126200 [Glycine max]